MNLKTKFFKTPIKVETSDLFNNPPLEVRTFHDIYVTDESCNFVVEDRLALNCNLNSLLVFPNKRNAQWELKIVCISMLYMLVLSWCTRLYLTIIYTPFASSLLKPSKTLNILSLYYGDSVQCCRYKDSNSDLLVTKWLFYQLSHQPLTQEC